MQEREQQRRMEEESNAAAEQWAAVHSAIAAATDSSEPSTGVLALVPRPPAVPPPGHLVMGEGERENDMTAEGIMELVQDGPGMAMGELLKLQQMINAEIEHEQLIAADL
jgi:hypothetical protein